MCSVDSPKILPKNIAEWKDCITASLHADCSEVLSN